MRDTTVAGSGNNGSADSSKERINQQHSEKTRITDIGKKRLSFSRKRKGLIPNILSLMPILIPQESGPKDAFTTSHFQQENSEASIYSSIHPETLMESELVVHSGGCHCKSVRWQVRAPASIVAWKCNCSDCDMRGNIHFVVPSQRFELLGTSKDFLTTYTFGTHTAKHTFCKVCGITSFYFPKSNPDGVAVTYRCVDSATLKHVEVRHFDGRNWDSSYAQTGIASCSKLPAQ